MKVLYTISSVAVLFFFTSCSDIYFEQEKPLNSTEVSEFNYSIIGNYKTSSNDTVTIDSDIITLPFGKLEYDKDFKLFMINDSNFMSFKFDYGWQYIEYQKSDDKILLKINKSEKDMGKFINNYTVNERNFLLKNITKTKFLTLRESGFFDKEYILKKID